MKRVKFKLLCLGILLIFIVSCGNKDKSKSPEKTDETLTVLKEVEPTIVFENNYAIVSKVTLKPGEVQPEHEGEKRVIYTLTDYTIDWKEQGKNFGAKTWKTGDVHYHVAGKHSAKNNGTETAEWLVFTKKNIELPDCGENTVENDVTSVAGDYAKSLFENDEFKVTKVNLPMGASIPQHSGVNRIIYSLSDYTLNYQSDSTDEMLKKFKNGDTHWHDACKHMIENKGNTDAAFLVVSFKK